MPGLVDRLLPPPVACVETFGDPPGAVLFPEEEAIVARAVAKRRAEFTAARHCARAALAAFGVPPQPILTGDKGAPVWPPGFVGSMTHCDGYRAAAVARSSTIITIGLDAEPHLPLPEGVLDLVSLPEERDWLAERARDHPDICWDRLLFSAKETVYKGWFPLARRWLGFTDASITVTPDGTFTARVIIPVNEGEPATLHGQWLIDNGLILTAATMRALQSAPSQRNPTQPSNVV